MEYIVITDCGDVVIAELESDGHLPPDERRDINSIAEAQHGDHGFPEFVADFNKLTDNAPLTDSEVLTLLNIYRRL